MCNEKYLLLNVDKDDADFDESMEKEEMLNMLAEELGFDVTKKEIFEVVGVGDTWSDYKCVVCGKILTINMEDSIPSECPLCREKDLCKEREKLGAELERTAHDIHDSKADFEALSRTSCTVLCTCPENGERNPIVHFDECEYKEIMSSIE